MTNNQEFDIIAPIAIYHFADVCFKTKAMKALRKAKKIGYAFYDGLDGPKYDAEGLASRYNTLFEHIINEEKPEWTPIVDLWGAKGFKDRSGRRVFTGDDFGFYPWYETSGLILERIKNECP